MPADVNRYWQITFYQLVECNFLHGKTHTLTLSVDSDTAFPIALSITGNTYEVLNGYTPSQNTSTHAYIQSDILQTELMIPANTTVEIYSVKLELGSVATPFESRSYGEELALCQRYFQVVDMSSNALAAIYNAHYDTFRSIKYSFPVTMRTAPTGSVISNSGRWVVEAYTPISGAGGSPYFTTVSTGWRLHEPRVAGYGVGYGSWANLYTKEGAQIFSFDAEL